MAFSDFKTISEVQEKFRIAYAEADFAEVEPLTPSMEFLRKTLNLPANIFIFLPPMPRGARRLSFLS